MSSPSGKVYIVGAGPGDAAFLTIAAQQLLSIADVVIYDALIDPQLLRLTPSFCRHIYVGKRGNQSSTPQATINQLLVDHCLRGKCVVRLKSGDPGLFGRIASEINALRERHCAVEVWPGLSSALAAPLLAGIPLTHPQWSTSVAIVSAHRPESLNWPALAGLDTLVLLMGGRSLVVLIQLLRQQGKSPETPIAIIRWGGRPQQQVWSGTLTDIVAQTQGESLSPSIIVIGDVVRQRTDWGPLGMTEGFLNCSLSYTAMTYTPNAPLHNCTVLVTRAASQASTFHDLLQKAGAQVLDMAALEITPPSSWDALDQAIATLDQFHWLILTSANGVQYFMDRLVSHGYDARYLAGVNIAVVGRKTAEVLKQWGLTPDFVPPNYVADSLVETFPEPSLAGVSCLFPRVESGGREILVQSLTTAGAQVTEVAAYQSICPAQMPAEIEAALQQNAINVITFASSKTVRHFCQLIQQVFPAADWQGRLSATRIASIGPQTSKTCRELLGRVDIEAQEYTLDGLTQSIIQFWQQKHSTPSAQNQ